MSLSCTAYQNIEGFPGHCDSCHDDADMGFGGMMGENENICCRAYDWIVEYEENYVDPTAEEDSRSFPDKELDEV